MITSSPGLSVANKALNKTCLPPVPTMIWLGLYSRPFSRLNLRAIASFSSGIPSTAVYLVLPARIALTAASLMFSGVSKSGSPAPSQITSRPAALRARFVRDRNRRGRLDALQRFGEERHVRLLLHGQARQKKRAARDKAAGRE